MNAHVTVISTQTSIHRHQTPPQYRNAARGSRFMVVQPPCFAIRPHVTSFTKPEVHNVSQRRQRKTKPRPRGSAQKFVKIGPAVPEICSRSDRHTHTHRQTGWSQYPASLPGRS